MSSILDIQKNVGIPPLRGGTEGILVNLVKALPDS
jgi:hypothetical protein